MLKQKKDELGFVFCYFSRVCVGGRDMSCFLVVLGKSCNLIFMSTSYNHMNKSYVSINVRKCTFDNGSGKCMLEKTY